MHVVAAQKLLDSERQTEIGGKYYCIGDHSPICSMANFQAQFLNPLGYRLHNKREKGVLNASVESHALGM